MQRVHGSGQDRGAAPGGKREGVQMKQDAVQFRQGAQHRRERAAEAERGSLA